MYEYSELLFGVPQARQGTTFTCRNQSVHEVVEGLPVVRFNVFSQYITFSCISKISVSKIILKVFFEEKTHTFFGGLFNSDKEFYIMLKFLI